MSGRSTPALREANRRKAADPNWRRRVSESARRARADPGYRKKMSETARRWYAVPANYQRWLGAVRRANAYRESLQKVSAAERDIESRRKSVRKWARAHRVHLREYARKRRAAGLNTSSTAGARRWRLSHPEASREHSRRWRFAHPRAESERHRRWAHLNPGKVRERNRKRGTRPTLRWLLRKVPGLRAVCMIGGGTAEHADHIVPVAKGGSDDPSNPRPLCARHNTMRGPARLTDDELRRTPCGKNGGGSKARE